MHFNVRVLPLSKTAISLAVYIVIVLLTECCSSSSDSVYIDDARIQSLDIAPVLGRGYSIMTNTYQSTCVLVQETTTPSFNFDCKFYFFLLYFVFFYIMMYILFSHAQVFCFSICESCFVYFVIYMCVVWCCVVLCGVVWCCVVLCGVVWCCVVLCGVFEFVKLCACVCVCVFDLLSY
jgi:hypothetical protein